MTFLELTPLMQSELEDPVVEFLVLRGALYLDDDGVAHIAKEHLFTYHEVLILLTNDVNCGEN